MNKLILMLAFSLALLSLNGCGRLISRGEYLDTMMADRADTAVMAYVPPASPEVSTVNRSGVVLATELRLDDPADMIVTGASSRSALVYRSDVRRQVEALTREMRLLESRAELKGAPARAALEPKLRTFNSAIDRLNARLGESRSIDNQLEVDVAIASAHQAAREANDAVNFTRGLGENRSGT
jgi:hypothetical protein